jgi:8-oxo-dGTP pyrophosphatase MutT (NUDIX family)
MKTNNPFRTLSSKTVYENPWMRVREDSVIRPDGTSGIYGVMESEDSVVIVALNNFNEIYLIKSYSYPAMAWSWTLPGGGSNSEDLEIAAKRELIEETGIVASSWSTLGNTRIAGGLITERTSFLLAQDLLFKERVDADDKDLIEKGKFVAFNDVEKMIASGEINDCQTITGFYFVRTLCAEHVTTSAR